MKRRIPIIALMLAVIVIAASAYATIAYFTASDKVTNVITAGNVKIELREMMLTEDSDTPVPFENKTGIMPGTEISKIVTVKNTGNNAAYIRISVKNVICKLIDNELAIDEKLTDKMEAYIALDFNDKDWTYKDDGYYYYNNALAAGEETAPLFTKAEFSGRMPDDYQNSQLRIDITAYATQVANNGTNVFDAAGWPN